MEKIAFDIKENGDYSPLIEQLDKLSLNHRHFLLVGDLGAGKTHLTKAWGKTMFIADEVSSPTYAIINEYELKTGHRYELCAHMDLYRLEDDEAFFEIGGLEYLDSEKTLCIIEWPELIADHLDEAVVVDIEVQANGSRKISLSLFSRR